MRLINETGKGGVYLAPKGATAKKDDSAQVIANILTKTFTYKNPDEFKANAGYVVPRVTGSFYKYWYKGGIDANYKVLQEQAAGRKNQRFMKNLQLTKYGAGKYFAQLGSGVLTGGTKESEIEPDQYAFEITRKNGKWDFERIKKIETIQDGD